MGIYIPDMKMPDSCFNCHYDDCPHWVSNSFEKPTDCPLIEIGDIEYRAFKGFTKMLLTKIEDRILYGERRADE